MELLDRDMIMFEKGMIEGWKHIQNICKICIKAHKETIKELKNKKRVK